MLTIGIIREGKTPPDMRTPLTPTWAKKAMELYPVKIVAQTSHVRIFKDAEYEAVGVEIRESLEDCDWIVGVKEVPIAMLIPNKKFMFFSHTIKKQPYNRKLLQAVVDNKISLTDYEVITNAKGKRLIGFGHWAGVVGAYNGLRAWGLMSNSFDLKPAHQCYDMIELNSELKKVQLPQSFKIVVTGKGRVGNGAEEVLLNAGIKKTSPYEYVHREHLEPVFTHLEVNHYYKRDDKREFDKKAFYQNPKGHSSDFLTFALNSDMYIPCHFWDNKAAYIFTRDMVLHPDLRLKLVADISCDIAEPIVTTLRPSTIANPFYGYHIDSGLEVPFGTPGSIGVVAVDNLPCELPRDASEGFAEEFARFVIPEMLQIESDVIRRATLTHPHGDLTPEFEYLRDYLDGH